MRQCPQRRPRRTQFIARQFAIVILIDAIEVLRQPGHALADFRSAQGVVVVDVERTQLFMHRRALVPARGAQQLPLPMRLTHFLHSQAAIVVGIHAPELLGRAQLAHVLPFGQAEPAVVVTV